MCNDVFGLYSLRCLLVLNRFPIGLGALNAIDVEKGGTHKMIANEVTVPANSVVDVTDKNNGFYLQETDLIRGGASAGTTVDCTISYEIMDDA